MSMRVNYGTVRMLLGEPNANLRHTFRQAFFREGFRGIDDCGSVEQITECLAKKQYEILLLDADMNGDDTLSLIRRLREKRLSRDPFPNVILITDPPQAERAKQIASSGADVILIRPTSIQTILERINLLIKSRRPFVVTQTYIGPERRNGSRSEAMLIPQIDVPNNLKNRAYGMTDDSLYLKSVSAVWGIIRQQRIERLIYQVGWLSKHLLPHEDDDSLPKNVKHIAMIEAALKSLNQWIDTVEHEKIYQVKRKLDEKANLILRGGAENAAEIISELRCDVRALEELWEHRA
ncbi:MAG: response regulator transcription factor [Magnetococcales bacterium]|nr:response regulator transcription factor [Magnetococcales bacterium]